MADLIATSLETVTLYLDGNIIQDGTGNWYCGETQAVVLLATYCRNVAVDAVIVSNMKETRAEYCTDIGIRIQDSTFCVSHIVYDEMPQKLKGCQLPAVISSDQMNIYSGLCTVLRYLVKKASNISSSNEAKHILSLLGHRQYCLKACSEVSPRTKLCEFYMPEVLKSKNLNLCELPQAIVLFEKLMSEPVMIHNMDKRQRVLLGRLDKDSESPLITAGMKRKRKKVVWTKDLPPLEHVFAEGVDFSLTDICIFPCIHFFVKKVLKSQPVLAKSIPKILKWYRRLMDVERFQSSVEKCAMKFIDDLPLPEKTSVTCNTDGVTQVLELAKSVNEGSLMPEKKDIALTIRRDLPALLEKLNAKGLTAIFSEFDHNEIALQWNEMPKEVHPVEGELNTLRALRKCHQIENLAYAVKSIARDGDTIVDFCSGGGHVGIVLAYLLPKCNIVLVENKEESLERARARIQALKMVNITIYQCNLEYFSGNFQIGVALHACGVASDMVVQSCISRKASFVISPCCYGKVRNCHWICYPQSKLYKEFPLSFEESLLLGHAADKTSWDFENKHAREGKICMGLVDIDRANAAKEHGYDVTLYTMQPPTCSPKNDMLFGISPSYKKV